MKSIHAACLAATLGTGLSVAAIAAPGDKSAPLYVNAQRSLSFQQPIARIEVDRDNIITIAAPNSHTIKITGAGVGDVQITIYAGDGKVMAQQQLQVLPRPAAASAELSADPRFTALSATRAGERVRLSGDVDDLKSRADAERMVAGTEGAVRNDLAVGGEQVVAVDVQFAAVSSSTLKALGFNFSKLTGDLQGAIVAPGSAAFSANGSSVDGEASIKEAFQLFLSAPNRGVSAVLSALSSNGLSELLAQPTLLVRSGERASFLAGGEIPIPVPGNSSGNNSISIEYKEFGVRLSVTPYVLSKDRIVLKIAPEVSELDYGSGVQLQGYTVPGLRRRSAETTVELGSGQSFVIAGLSYSNSSITKDKVPLLGDIPVLGAFFKRQQTQKEHQELIIVATPRLVGPMRAGTLPPLPTNAALLQAPGGKGPDGLDQANAPFGVVRR